MGDLVRAQEEDVAIAVGECATWLQQRAAEEFARYAEQVTGRRPARVAASEAQRWRGPVIAIGSPAVNPLTRSLEQQGRLAVEWDGLGRDGFVEQSVQEGERRYLVLAGATDIATLYAVYDYLERFVGIGFFPDGEVVPRGNLPLEDIRVLEKPRFVDRFWNSDMGGWSLKKYQTRFWTLEEWKRQIEWMVKRKLNMTNYLMMSDSFLSVRVEDRAGDRVLRAPIRREPPGHVQPDLLSAGTALPSFYGSPGDSRLGGILGGKGAVSQGGAGAGARRTGSSARESALRE